jgi:hypothetical protein
MANRPSFICLTTKNDAPVWVNPTHIVSITLDNVTKRSGSTIHFSQEAYAKPAETLAVIEDPNTVLDLIRIGG